MLVISIVAHVILLQYIITLTRRLLFTYLLSFPLLLLPSILPLVVCWGEWMFSVADGEIM